MSGIKKRFAFAFNGLRLAWKGEWSFKVHLLATLFAVGFLICTKPEPVWWAIVFLAIGSVLAAELLNTALESALNITHPEFHPLIKKSKDCAAAAVLVLSFVALAIFATLLWQLYLPKV
jgi:undecaprenol kinase